MPIDSRVEINDAEVKRALERLRLSLPIGGDMKPAFTSIGRIVKTGTQLRFRKQQSPEGEKWKPSKRALDTGGQTLRLTGRLQRSLTYEADHTSVAIGTNVRYGRIHQFGGKAGRGHKVKLPARPYLGLSKDDSTEAIEALNSFLQKRWSGG